MKFLVDSCVAPAVTAALRAAGHDAEAVSEWPKDPGDEEILRRAAAESRILVTLDLGFGDRIFRDRAKHAGVLRMAAMDPEAQVAVCIRALKDEAERMAQGAVVVADRKRTRVHPTD